MPVDGAGIYYIMETSHPQSNIIVGTINYLSRMPVEFSKEYVEDFLKNDADYPSLASVSALLNDFKIENVAIRITPDQLDQIPTPVMAYLGTGNDGNFVVLHKPVAGNTISY